MKNRTGEPVRLTVDGEDLTFHTLRDLEFCLDARTQMPAQKMLSLTRRSAELLHEEARNIRKVERRFTDIIAKAMENPRSLARAMHEIDRQIFSQDFRWRSIMAAVIGLPDEHHDFRHAAMSRYLEYLRSRQEALRGAYVEQRRRDDTPALATPPDGQADPQGLRETSIFDVEDIPSAQGPGPDGLTVLPRGETVRVRPPRPDRPMRMMLSRYRFTLLGEDGLRLCTDKGVEFPLAEGRNVIGRDLGNEVVIDAGYRDISRRHLVIDSAMEGWLHVTDLSSHGSRLEVPPVDG